MEASRPESVESSTDRTACGVVVKTHNQPESTRRGVKRPAVQMWLGPGFNLKMPTQEVSEKVVPFWCFLPVPGIIN